MAGQQLVNAVIGQYEIVRHLEVGGMSSIYLARNRDTLADVVFKIVPQDIPEYSERFLREAHTTMTFQHQHILPALDYGEYQSWYYLVSPYIAAGSLRAYIERQKTLDISHTGRLLAQLTSAVEYAHQRGVLHRDIKAANVLMRDAEFIYLADFGLAKSVNDDFSLTQTGYLIGTPDYMAPELMEGEATAASDIYAMGVLLFFMLTGVMPFRGPTPMSVMLKHLNAPVPFPRDFNPDIPRPVELVLLNALSKDPRDRYQTPRALLEAYRDALDEADRTQTQLAAIPAVNAVQSTLSNASTAALPVAGTYKTRSRMIRSASSYPHPRLFAGVSVMAVCLFGVVMLAANIEATNAHSLGQSPTTSAAGARKPTATATKVVPTPTPTPHASVVKSSTRSATTSSKINAQSVTDGQPTHYSQSNGNGKGNGDGKGKGHG